MKTIVLHYYDGQFSTDPTTNRMQPIVCALSAARRQNPQAEIVLFENSTQKQEWGRLPDILQFQVIRTKPLDVFNIGQPVCHSRSMAKLWDIAETKFRWPHVAVYPSYYIPIHTDQNYLYMDRLYVGGEGCFAYNQHSERAVFTLDGWRGLCLLFAQSQEFRRRILEFTKGQIVTEYTLAQYMSCHNMYEVHHLSVFDFLPLPALTYRQPFCSGVILPHDYCGQDKLKIIAGFKELRTATNWELLTELIPAYREIKTANFSLADMWTEFNLSAMREHFGLELKKTAPFWEPDRNNDFRAFQREVNP